MKERYCPPAEGKSPFTCPKCGVVSQQAYSRLGTQGNLYMEHWPSLSQCQNCDAQAIWYRGKMLLPATGGMQPPSADLPKDIKGIYNEARAVSARSPRAAAALLRLCVEKLCIELNGEQPNLDSHIAHLVAKGLDEKSSELFDAVRLAGNSAIHPIDRISLGDNLEMVRTLFWLVNEIAEDVITKPNRRANATRWIPQDERERMAKRNTKAVDKLRRESSPAR